MSVLFQRVSASKYIGKETHTQQPHFSSIYVFDMLRVGRAFSCLKIVASVSQIGVPSGSVLVCNMASVMSGEVLICEVVT